MSWIDQAREDMIIVMGDGREFRPLWKEPQKAIEYNIAQFEFPGIEGTRVSRGTRKGRKFPLELYFVGEFHIQEADRFETSARDERHWVVTHPYYGVINAHPLSINIDNTGGNVSKITVSLLETIVEQNPKGVDTPVDFILSSADVTGEALINYAAVNIPAPSIQDKNLMTKNVTSIYNEGQKTIKDIVDAENYFNLFTEATAAILNATADVTQAMTTIQAMIDAPFQFADTVRNRFNTLKNQFDALVTIFVRPSEKRIYESTASFILGSMAKTLVTNFNYQSSDEVILITGDFLDTYNSFITTLDSLQSENGAIEGSYVPDPDSMIKLQDLVNYTVSKLIEIALDSKQERSVVLEYDSNVIILAHRFYGLLPDDSTIDYLIETNKLGMDYLLQIPAGTVIKYYI